MQLAAGEITTKVGRRSIPQESFLVESLFVPSSICGNYWLTAKINSTGA